VANADVVLPAEVTGGDIYFGKLAQVPRIAKAKVPVILFLHGSSGLGLKAIGEWQRGVSPPTDSSKLHIALLGPSVPHKPPEQCWTSITRARRATNSLITNQAIGWAFSHSLDPKRSYLLPYEIAAKRSFVHVRVTGATLTNGSDWFRGWQRTSGEGPDMRMRMFVMNCDSGIDDALALMLAPPAATAYY
jgi:hypothetical protein